MTDAEAYAAPTPKVFYIHDDLSEYICQRQGEASPARQLTHELFALVRRDPSHVVVLTLEWQIARLLAHGTYTPFALTIESVGPVNAWPNNSTREPAGFPRLLV